MQQLPKYATTAPAGVPLCLGSILTPLLTPTPSPFLSSPRHPTCQALMQCLAQALSCAAAWSTHNLCQM